eukprot:scaffold253275_cov43-Prasinocladus_malaysianus.AAC.3
MDVPANAGCCNCQQIRGHAVTIYLHVVLVNVLEALGLLRQLLHNVSAAEDGLHIHPHVLHHEPLLDDLADGRQLDDPELHLVAEGSAVAVGGHAAEGHLRVLELLNQLGCVGGLQDHGASGLVLSKGEVQLGPLVRKAGQLGLNLLFLDGGTAQLFDVLGYGEEVGVQQVLELEDVLGKVEVLAGHRHNLLPMPIAHRRAGQLLEQGQNLQEVVDGLAAVLVGGPVAEPLGQLLGLCLEHVDLLSHRVDLLHHVNPEVVTVAADGRDYVDIEAVEPVKHHDLALCLLELRVLCNSQAKELLAAAVVVPLVLVDVKHLLELFEAVDGVHWVEALHHGPVGLPVVAEGLGVDHKLFDLLDELALEADLQPRQVVADIGGQLAQLLPRVAQVAHHVGLLLWDGDLVAQQQGVHFLDGVDEVVDVALLLTHLLQDAHHRAHILEVLYLAIELEGRVSHVGVEHLKVLGALLVQVLGKLGLPAAGLALQAILKRLGLQRQAADVVNWRDQVDLCLVVHVFLQLGLKVLQHRVAGHEFVVLGLQVHHPEELKLLEAGDILQDGGLGALDRPRQQQDALDDLLVANQHFVVGAEVARAVAPGNEVLGRAQHFLGCGVDGLLDVVERGVHHHAGDH